ncbi:MAG: tryptophan--tRNA ligase [Bacillota bacterium]|nr:tryptophan--tRNA ligase [Bacillota bacterium]
MSEKQRLLSGMRPTGRLHLGHQRVIEYWAQLSEKYEAYWFTADWHAITTQFDNTEQLRDNRREIVIDWLSAGLDADKCHIFHQSEIKEHAELHLLFSMITPLSWLERVPTYKGQVAAFAEQGKDITTYGFLGYPLLMAADILMYRPVGVPVATDQMPHIEFCRELVRRFHHLYDTRIFPEPAPIFSKIEILPGTDNRKMSKSYDNFISLSATAEEVKSKVWSMVTDAERIRKTDPGHPDICAVYAYHGFYNKDEQPELCAACKAGAIGCGECKKKLTERINAFLEPVRDKRAYYEQHPAVLDEIIADGNDAARSEAQKTMAMVREAMRL